MDNNSLQKESAKIQEAILIDTNECKKDKLKRALYVAGGSFALVLAVLGIFIPGLPVTPLALLAAALYAKSSDKLYNWLLNNKIFGPRIRNYKEKKGVTRKGKLGILALMSIMVLFSSFVVIRENMIVRYIILSLGVIGTIVVWFFVPNAKEDTPEKP